MRIAHRVRQLYQDLRKNPFVGSTSVIAGGLFLAALTIRLAYAIVARDLSADPRHANEWIDASEYVSIALNVAHGRGYTLNGEDATAYRPPGYVLFLASQFLFTGENFATARMVDIVLASLLVPIVFLVGAKMLSRLGGLLGALGILVHPMFIMVGPSLYSDTLALVLLCGFMLVLPPLAEWPTNTRGLFLSGVLLAFACVTRTELMLSSALIALWVLSRRAGWRTTARTLSLLLGPVVILLSIWVGRNYVALGSPTVGTTLGENLLGVYNDDAFADPRKTGTWTRVRLPGIRMSTRYTAKERGQSPEWRYLPEVQYDMANREAAWESIVSHFAALPKMVAYKIARMSVTLGGTQVPLRLLLLFCAALGILVSLAVKKELAYVLLCLLFASYLASILLYANLRHMMVADMALFLFGGFGIQHGGRIFRLVRMSSTDF